MDLGPTYLHYGSHLVPDQPPIQKPSQALCHSLWSPVSPAKAEEEYMVHKTAGAMWSLRVLIVYMPHIKEELLVDMIQAECKNRQDDRREIPLREISRHTQQPGQVVCASRQETGARASTMHRSMSISSQAASQSVEWNWNSQSENDAGLDTQSQSQSCNALVAVESPNQNASSSSAAASSMRMTWGTVNKSLDTCHRNHLIKRIHHLENKCSELQKE